MDLYVIVNKTSRVCGHGDSEDICVIAAKGPYGSDGFHPAFETRKRAEENLNELRYPQGMSIMELEVME